VGDLRALLEQAEIIEAQSGGAMGSFDREIRRKVRQWEMEVSECLKPWPARKMDFEAAPPGDLFAGVSGMNLEHKYRVLKAIVTQLETYYQEDISE